MRAEWQQVALGSAFETVTGSTPPKNNASYYGRFMPLVKPPELCDAKVDSADDGLSEAGVKVARTALPNSVLVSCIGNLAKVGLNTVPVAFNQQINAILPDTRKAIPEFMFYQALSSSFKDQMEELASGTTVSIVNKSKFNSIRIVLPPLPEQQRVVAILDEAFEGIDAAVANTERNLANVRELVATHSESILEDSTLGGSEQHSLAELCVLIVDCEHKTAPTQTAGIPSISRAVQRSQLKLHLRSALTPPRAAA